MSESPKTISIRTAAATLGQKPLRTMAWVVMSKPMPDNGLERVDDIIVSVHTNCHEADIVALRLKQEVFAKLSTDLRPLPHWVARLLTYRDSIHVRTCSLNEVTGH